MASLVQYTSMKPGKNTRRHPRSRWRTAATLVLSDGLTRLPVRILDASPDGARLELGADIDLPGEFYVLFEHRLEPCRLVWRDGRILGIAYQGST